jgi:hypothetical protein
VKIRSGKLDLFESGFINSASMEDIEFSLSESPPMTVVLRVKKSAEPAATIDLALEGDDRLLITYTNAATQLNFGSQGPIKLGSLSSRSLYAVLRVNVIGDYTSFQVAYSFYLGDEEK